jgi:hypothetical protein
MSLRTYPLIIHPAFLTFVERELHSSGAPIEVTADGSAFIPRIDNISDICDYLQIAHFTMRSIFLNVPRHYRSFTISKRNGEQRIINSPKTFLKVIQWWIYDTILQKYSLRESVYGFRKGRSFIGNARAHLGARNVLNVDIKDFLGSVRIDGVEKVFAAFGYSSTVCTQLRLLTTLHGSLPQGAPTSPQIANIYLDSFDRQMEEISINFGITYTRYADDLTFSSKDRIPTEVLDTIKVKLGERGLELNASKTRFMGPNAQKEVTGLILGTEKVNLSLRFRNGARGWFHALRTRENVAYEEIERLRGTIALIRSVGGVQAERLISQGEETLKLLQRRLWLEPEA